LTWSSAIGAFIDLAEKAGAQVVYPAAGNAAPSAPVENDAYESMAGRIVEAVAAGCDAVLLDLHGAMVTRTHDDGEGELLGRIRKVAPGVPTGVALDMHTNLFPAMARHATVIAGYQTYPHVDMYETGVRAGRPILRILERGSKTEMAWGTRPMAPTKSGRCASSPGAAPASAARCGARASSARASTSSARPARSTT
jgi:microcystin degradation protein MlrC